MKKNIKKIFLFLFLILFVTGCTQTLKDPKTKKVVTYEDDKVKITLNQNILCKPNNEGLTKKYNEYKKQININKLPECSNFTPSDGNYNNLWETLVVKPLAWLTIKIGNLVHSYGIALIILSIIIRLILAPFTKKTAMQSENMKKMQPEMDRINKKYENKNDQQSMNQKSMEMMSLYKKYNINPFSSCLFAFIQIPLLFGFLEAVNRVPVIFEENLFGLILGTTPWKAITSGHIEYVIILILIIGTTFISQKLNKTAPTPQTNDINPNTMTNFMLIMIAIMSLNFSVAISLYWIASTLFTIVQNLIVKKSAEKEVK
ncbi:MAG: YidC/Oxa1 family membrane protein insertase [Bacilli bacterium]|nr:YidC/Oxa1 family membrane protein insertase [Bacilli bacterium]